jgi:hypothetical protein
MRSQKLDAFKCVNCSVEMQKARDCNGTGELTKSVFYHSEVGEFFSCPIIFVSDAVAEFVNEYDYYEKYPSATPNYKAVNPRYWKSVNFFEKIMFDLTSDKKPVNNSESSMKKMQGLFGGTNGSGK